MAEQTNSWNDVANSKGRGGIRNMKFVSGNTYDVRFIGHPEKFYKYFVAGKSAICADPDTCPVKKKYNLDPGERWAINLIDRSDKVLKLLECPPSVLKPVAAWGKRRNQDPGGRNGCDFSIEVTGSGKQTRYTVVSLDITPLTDEEIAYIKANVYDLKRLFKPTPPEEIEAKLFAKEAAPAAASSNTTPANAPAASGVDLPF